MLPIYKHYHKSYPKLAICFRHDNIYPECEGSPFYSKHPAQRALPAKTSPRRGLFSRFATLLASSAIFPRFFWLGSIQYIEVMGDFRLPSHLEQEAKRRKGDFRLPSH